MNKNCLQCSAAINNELPGGLCPACLMAVAQKSMHAELATEAVMGAGAVKTPSAEEITRLFPDLEVLEFIGRGGMGAVFRVRQKKLDRVVALKVFLDRPGDPEFAARFHREAVALAKLNHPNIVTVHDFGQKGNIHFLIMEYVDGLNLRQLTQEDRLTPEMALQMVPQLCDALQFAHENGVIHRDIKPENLLLDTSGHIRIADFGLAKMTGSVFNGTLTHTQQVMGTFNYMAPEQRERPTEVDHRADIYSLGVVIYEMLTGELPIGRFQPPSSKSPVDPRLDEVVMRALEKEPERRYQHANEFKTGFSAFEHQHGQANRQPSGQPASQEAAFQQAGFQQGAYQPTNAYQNNVGSPNMSPVPPIKAGVPSNGTRCMMTIMSGREKKGNWTPGDPQLAFTMMGGTCLDLTNVQTPHVNLTLFTMMGGTEVIVPHGAEVDLDGFILMGASVDKVVQSDGPSRMKVRIRSWGAMGGCEVRTPKRLPPATVAKMKEHKYRTPPQHKVTFRSLLVLLYKMFAMLVTLAVPIVFLAGAFNVADEDDTKLAGIICAIVAGMIWCGTGYFRRLIDAGPEETDEESLAEYYSTSVIGTMIRIVALMTLFACPILFVVAAFEGDDDDIRLAAIICAIVGGVLFVLSGMVEDFFFGKRDKF